MNSNFERLFRLAKKTGDRLIVFDSNTDNHMVIMGIDEYEELIDLQTKSELDYLESNNILENIEQLDNIPGIDFESIDQSDWHSTKEILDDVHPEFVPEQEEKPENFELKEPVFEPINEPYGQFEQKKTDDEEPRLYEPVAESPHFEPIEQKNFDSSFVLQEESLDDEPVFFEEPID